MATVRFRDLVNASGKPETKTLWTDPKRDRDFTRAAKQGRILTVVQEPRSKKKDFGEVGFHEQPHATYLIFPKSLHANKGAKVVGIKYDLIEEPEPKDALPPESLKSSPKKKSRRVKPPKESLKEFKIRVRRVATLREQIVVAARTKKDALVRAAEQAAAAPFDASRAEIKTEVLDTK
jgi:hypothetical protein